MAQGFDSLGLSAAQESAFITHTPGDSDGGGGRTRLESHCPPGHLWIEEGTEKKN